MTQVKDKTDQQLNRALAELMGWTNFREGGHEIIWGDPPDDRWTNMMPDYCNDATATAELQARAIVVNEFQYIENLAAITQADTAWGFKDGRMQTQGISWLLTASPRERAEAAYITLQGAVNT